MIEFAFAESAYRIIKSSSCVELQHDFFRLCVDYARQRAEWTFLSGDERRERDASRTATHNALISQTNALARNMREAGEDASWRADLGDSREREGRRRLGDFACYIFCLLAIEQR